MLKFHETMEAEKETISAWHYAGEYAIYDLPPYAEAKARGQGLANPKNHFLSFYDGQILMGFLNLVEIINGIFFVGTQRKIVVSRRKHDKRNVIFVQRLQHLKRVHVRHLDIEKNDIRIKLMYLLNCLRTRTGFTQNFQFARIRFEQRAHAHTSKRFIIGYQDSKQFFSPLLVNLFIETHHDCF